MKINNIFKVFSIILSTSFLTSCFKPINSSSSSSTSTTNSTTTNVDSSTSNSTSSDNTNENITLDNYQQELDNIDEQNKNVPHFYFEGTFIEQNISAALNDINNVDNLTYIYFYREGLNRVSYNTKDKETYEYVYQKDDKYFTGEYNPKWSITNPEKDAIYKLSDVSIFYDFLYTIYPPFNKYASNNSTKLEINSVESSFINNSTELTIKHIGNDSDSLTNILCSLILTYNTETKMLTNVKTEIETHETNADETVSVRKMMFEGTISYDIAIDLSPRE